MHEQPRNRDWVKNAAIIFLVVLLVLTFFSNTIMNRSLPEVATQEVESGSIVARVRGTGTVQANSNTQVKMDRTRVIRSVLVKVGQKVEAGDVLFTLGEGASEEIDAAEEKLQNLQASYNRTAATIPDFSYSADQLRIESYRQAYVDAENKVKDIENRLNQELEARQRDTDTELAQAKERLAAAQLLKDTIEKIYNDDISGLESELRQAKENQPEYVQKQIDLKNEELEAAKQEKAEYDAAQSEIAAIQETINQLDSDITSKNEQIAAKQAEIDSTQNEIDEINREITGTMETLEADLQALIDEQNRLSYNLQAGQMDEDNAKEINRQYEIVTQQITEKQTEINTKQAEFSGKEQRKAELEQMISGQEWEKSNYETEKTTIETAKSEKEAEKAAIEGQYPVDPQTKIIAINAEIASLVSQGISNTQLEELAIDLKSVSREDLDAAILYLEKCQAEFDSLWATLDPKMNSELQYAKEALRNAQLNYETAKASLREKISSNETTLAGYNVDLANLWQQIQRAQEKLDDLLGGEEATVTAKVAGTIQTLDASPGDTKKKDDVIATIEAPDMGYTLSFSVTNDQANRLRVGDTATVSNFYWGSEITATLTSIKIDQKNPQTNKILTFDLNGNVTSGTELTLSVGQKSANYDVIIPSSSVRTDANGTYVLKLESKNSPLGNRYLARRVPVEVLAVDDTNTAVSAELGYGDYVITSSSSPLKNGELVRLATSA
ncbi:MAG: HlyD family efflux transporter periplasmic adaptor subunit [Oscillospiraceae bacterium]|nr:HlyD family efflux transporter periplasmic adaptor subunit [Oscillospiraceae bacterium]